MDPRAASRKSVPTCLTDDARTEMGGILGMEEPVNQVRGTNP